MVVTVATKAEVAKREAAKRLCLNPAAHQRPRPAHTIGESPEEATVGTIRTTITGNTHEQESIRNHHCAIVRCTSVLTPPYSL